RMWEELRRFRALPSQAQRLFLRAMVALPLLRVSLWRRGFQATQESLCKRGGTPETNASSDGEPIAIPVRMVRAAARHGFPSASCLEESLALWWLLARQGIASELRIGVRKDAERIEAHAWVERDGAALNEPLARHAHYAAFETEFPLSR